MRTPALSRITAALAVAAACVALAACGGKINQTNYTKINTGMSQAEVEAILGPGTEQGSSSVAVPAMPSVPGVPAATGTPALGAPGTTVSTKVLTWRDGNKMISVTMMNDKVVSKAQVGL
jgi:hypothetical protein